MKIYKLFIFIALLLLFVPVVYAADDAVIFDSATKILSVDGWCEKKEVLVLIYYAGADKIWGSGNVKCKDGQYRYRQNFNDWKISDGEFEVEVFDGGYKAKNNSPGAEIIREKVIVDGMNLKNSELPDTIAPSDNILPADGGLTDLGAATGTATGSTEAGADDFSLNGILNAFFGMVRDAGDAIRNFAVVIAKTVKTTALAAVKIFAKDLAIVPDGKIIVPAGENQMAGRAVISAGMAQVKINNVKITGQSKIFLTALSEINSSLAIIEKNNGQGFTVGISQVAEKDIAFDWFIIDSYNAEPDAAAPSIPASEISPSETATSTIAEEAATSTISAPDLPEEPPVDNSASTSTISQL